MLAIHPFGVATFCRFPYGENVCFSPVALVNHVLVTRLVTGCSFSLSPDWSQLSTCQDTARRLHDAWRTVLPDPTAGRMTNAIFVRAPEPSLLRITGYVDTEVYTVDFNDGDTCLRLARQWAENPFRGSFRQVGDLFPSQATLITLNAIHVLPNWKYPFVLENTKLGMFKVDQVTAIQTTFMSQRGTFPITEHRGVQVLALPYDDDAFSMLFCVPLLQGMRHGYMLTVCPDFFLEVLDLLRPETVDVTIPKFTYECSLDLGTVVYQPIEAVKMVQTTSVCVREKGAWPADVGQPRGLENADDVVRSFKANTPFWYAVIHKPSKSFVLLGCLIKPDRHRLPDIPRLEGFEGNRLFNLSFGPCGGVDRAMDHSHPVPTVDVNGE